MPPGYGGAPGGPAGAAGDGSSSSAGEPGQADMRAAMAAMGGNMGSSGGLGSMMGAANQPPSFRTPEEGFMAFYNALKAKDGERLADATALHVQNETPEKHKKMFTAILDKALSENQLNDLSKSLEGYSYAGRNQVKSSAKVTLIFQKYQGNDQYRRTVTMRNEKNGWKVLDISDVGEIKGIRGIPRRGMPGRAPSRGGR